jgi:hypothetical protein
MGPTQLPKDEHVDLTKIAGQSSHYAIVARGGFSDGQQCL